MNDNYESYTKDELRIATGGVKEFVYTKENMKRIRSSETSSSKEFKKYYYLNRFYENPRDSRREYELEKYVKFHEIKINVFDKNDMPHNKFIVTIEVIYKDNKFNEILVEKNSKGIIINLPEGRYRFIFVKKYFIFVTSSPP